MNEEVSRPTRYAGVQATRPAASGQVLQRASIRSSSVSWQVPQLVPARVVSPSLHGAGAGIDGVDDLSVGHGMTDAGEHRASLRYG
jgi:hypothetical protein